MLRRHGGDLPREQQHNLPPDYRRRLGMPTRHPSSPVNVAQQPGQVLNVLSPRGKRLPAVGDGHHPPPPDASRRPAAASRVIRAADWLCSSRIRRCAARQAFVAAVSRPRNPNVLDPSLATMQ